MTRQRRTFTPEFKLQLVKLYENGKSRADIAREYDLTPSALDRWIKNHTETGSFVAKDNRRSFHFLCSLLHTGVSFFFVPIIYAKRVFFSHMLHFVTMSRYRYGSCT